MQKTSRDWKLTLSISRSFIEKYLSSSEKYYSPQEKTNLILSRGFIQNEFQQSLEILPSPKNSEEQLVLTILNRFKEMERNPGLPTSRFLYSYIMDTLELLDGNNQEVLDTIYDILLKKSDEYSQAFRSIGPEGIKARIWEKICRYISLSANTEIEINYEPLVDSLKDLLGYLIILLALTLE